MLGWFAGTEPFLTSWYPPSAPQVRAGGDAGAGMFWYPPVARQ